MERKTLILNVKIDFIDMKYTTRVATKFGETDMVFLIKDVEFIVVEIKISVKKKMAELNFGN